MCLIAPTTDKPLVQLVDAVAREQIGFEFETDLQIAYESNREFVYQTLLFQRVDKTGRLLWSIIVDGIDDDGRSAVLEFRTEPLSSTEALYDCIMDMAVFAFRVGERVKQSKPGLSFVDVVTQLDGASGLTSAAAGLLLTGGSSVGAPQATIGIALCNVAQALVSAQRFELSEFAWQERLSTVPPEYRLFLDQRIALSGLRSAAEFDGPGRALGWAREMEQDIVNNPSLKPVFQDPTVIPVLAGYQAGQYELPDSQQTLRGVLDAYSSAGLMALTLTYLNAGWYVFNRVKYSKAAFPVMARNSFAQLFAALKKRGAFTADAALRLFGLVGDQIRRCRVFQNGFRAELKPLFRTELVPRLIQEGRLSNDGATDYGPRIADWVNSIVDGRYGSSEEGCQYYDKALEALSPPVRVSGCDLLSRGSVRYSSTSLGSLPVVTISNVPFAVVEFREWPKVSLYPQFWVSLATRLYEFYYLHGGACSDFPSPWVKRPDLLWFYRDLKLKRSVWANRGFHYTPGNCLFDSTAYQLNWQHNIQYASADLRAMAAKEIADHPELYLDFISGDSGDEDPFTVVQNAAAYLRVDRNWEEDVADLAVAALANALNRQGASVTLNVIGLNGRTIQAFGKGDAVVELLYNGIDHYMPYFFLPPDDGTV